MNDLQALSDSCAPNVAHLPSTPPTPQRSHAKQVEEAKLAAASRTAWSQYFLIKAIASEAAADTKGSPEFLTIGEIEQAIEAKREMFRRAAA